MTKLLFEATKTLIFLNFLYCIKNINYLKKIAIIFLKKYLLKISQIIIN